VRRPAGDAWAAKTAARLLGGQGEDLADGAAEVADVEAIGNPWIARLVPEERFMRLALCFGREDDGTAGHLSLARRCGRAPPPRDGLGAPRPDVVEASSGLLDSGALDNFRRLVAHALKSRSARTRCSLSWSFIASSRSGWDRAHVTVASLTSEA
jgi:hypothetical protein